MDCISSRVLSQTMNPLAFYRAHGRAPLTANDEAEYRDALQVLSRVFVRRCALRCVHPAAQRKAQSVDTKAAVTFSGIADDGTLRYCV